MSKSTALKCIPLPAHITPPPPCPPWCTHDEYSPAWPAGDDYVQHHSPEWLIHSPNELLLETFDLVVQMDRMDEVGQVGDAVITIGARHYGVGYEHPEVGSLTYTDQLPPKVARQLAAALLEMADAAEVTR